MDKLQKWLIAGAAAATIAGIAFVVPVAAGGFGGMMSMHSTMVPLMDQMPAMHSEMVSSLSMNSTMSDFLNRQVQEGAITQQQAAQLISFMAERQEACLSSGGMMRGMGAMMNHMKSSY